MNRESQSLTLEEEETAQIETGVNFKEVGTQTIEEEVEPDSFHRHNPLNSSYLIREKAYSSRSGFREETPVATMVSPKEQGFLASSLRPGIYRWDVSRSRSLGHQVSHRGVIVSYFHNSII